MTVFKKEIKIIQKVILNNYNKHPQRNLLGFSILRKIGIKKNNNT